ncbi:EamA family transporter [Neptuniibacter halophilus]|uniref:EamA family transporter n=1 Tax=Neptuniibacter halophilus TaxID=651666 RepID=UPI0025730944|nr:EamA family transporter [Neptuniibacter halophilus]
MIRIEKGALLTLALTALAPVLWGSTYIVTSELLPPDRPYTAALIRVLPAGLLLLMLFSRQLPQRTEWLRLLILAALNIGVFQALLFIAAYRLPGGIAAVVGAIQPLLVMLLIWGLDRIQPGILTLIAAGFGVLGMAALLLTPDATWDSIGLLAAFVGALSMAAGTYFSRRWSLSLAVEAFTGWQLLLGGVLLLPLALWLDPPLVALGLTEVAAYAYLSLFGALLAYLLWFRGLARLSPVAVSSLGLLSPVSAVLLGWTLLDQSISGISLLGLITVLLSVLAVQWGAQFKPGSARPAKSN